MVVAVAAGLLIEAAVIVSALYRFPARLLGMPPIERFAVVSNRDELYWSVEVSERGWLETFVIAHPSEVLDGAQRGVETTYNAIEVRKGGTVPANGMRARLVPRAPGRVPGWFSTKGHDPAPYRVPGRPTQFIYSIRVRAVGWPFRCLWGEAVQATVIPPLGSQARYNGSHTMHRLARGQIEFSEHAFPLPWFPIWRGLALNLLVFAVPVLLLQWAAGACRASLRRRRGRCPVCNYDREGLGSRAPCPECGAVDRRPNQPSESRP